MSGALLRIPSKALKRFRLSAQSGLVAGLFLLAVALPTLFMVRGQNVEAALLRREQEGAGFLGPLQAFTAHVAQHRLEVQNQQWGADQATDNGPSLASLEAAVDDDLARLEVAAKRLDPALRRVIPLRTLHDAWLAVLATTEPEAQLKAHDDLLKTIRGVDGRVAEGSGLSQDWDPARNGLAQVDAALLARQTGFALDLGSRAQDVASGKPLTAEGRVLMQQDLDALRTKVDAVREDLDGARGFSNPEAALRLGTRLQDYLRASEAFARAVGAGILGDRPAVSLPEIRYLGRAAVLSCLQFQEAGLKVLDDLLAERLRATRWEQRVAIGGSLLAAALAFGLLAALTTGLKEGLAAISGGLADLKGGGLAPRPQAASRDEVGALARELDAALAGLAEILGGITETAREVEASAGFVTERSVALTRRTQAQAAGLEEAVGGAQALSTGAAQARRQAEKADQDLQHLGELIQGCAEAVGTAAQAMDGLGGCLPRLARAVKTWEDLAFDAELHALQAVRAPLHADPAQELALAAGRMRELGRRSGGAADALRGLLDEVTALLRSGAEPLARAATLAQGLDRGLQEVAAFSREVAAAAGAQMEALDRISQAMAGLDAATQRNRALMEGASAAAGTLAEQARGLAARIARLQF